MSQVPSNSQEIISVSDINNLAKGLLEKDLSNVGYKAKFLASQLMDQAIGTLP